MRNFFHNWRMYLYIQTNIVLYRFGLKNDYIGMGPAFVYVLIVGALSDKYGRKPLLLFPMIGRAIEKIALLMGSLFFYQVLCNHDFLAQ